MHPTSSRESRPDHESQTLFVYGTGRNKLTKKKSHCWPLRLANALNGLGVLAMGGLSDENLVAIYLPALISSGVSPS